MNLLEYWWHFDLAPLLRAQRHYAGNETINLIKQFAHLHLLLLMLNSKKATAQQLPHKRAAVVQPRRAHPLVVLFASHHALTQQMPPKRRR